MDGSMIQLNRYAIFRICSEMYYDKTVVYIGLKWWRCN